MATTSSVCCQSYQYSVVALR
ncbi:hypothetical protein Pint_35061 [Pistacia integerrima]|uniref:Uncharacterized protein n=1 Tax=Pistacia integerrima TaxID=434235 RepID=A0ACC0Y0J7_9ROSI|nr:hypothetical protein Pint_35061 [Pistacia integerrima]